MLNGQGEEGWGCGAVLENELEQEEVRKPKSLQGCWAHLQTGQWEPDKGVPDNQLKANKPQRPKLQKVPEAGSLQR